MTGNDRTDLRLVKTQNDMLLKGQQSGVNSWTHIGTAVSRNVIASGRFRGLTKAQKAALTTSLRDAMAWSHLQGVLLVKALHGTDLAFQTATVYKKSMRFLIERASLSPAMIAALTKVYGPVAGQIVGTLDRNARAKVNAAITRSVKLGEPTRAAAARVQRAIRATGFVPTNSFAAEGIFRTQSQLAYAAGQEEVLQLPIIQDAHWGYKYVTVGDDRVRPSHAAMDGVTLPKTSSFWAENKPPNGWACRCAIIPLFNARKTKRPPRKASDGGKVEADKDFRFDPRKVNNAVKNSTLWKTIKPSRSVAMIKKEQSLYARGTPQFKALARKIKKTAPRGSTQKTTP